MATLTLQAADATMIDTYIREGSASETNATSDQLYFSGSAGGRVVSLLRFDVSSIAGSIVNSATLYLTNSDTSGANRTLYVYNILSANGGWIEACSWDYAEPSTTRWAGDSASDGGTDAGCSVSGTDYNSTAIGTFSYTASTAVNTEHSTELTTSAVQGWVNGGNYGMALWTPGALFPRCYSSRTATETRRPKLVIDYSLPVASLLPPSITARNQHMLIR